MKRIISLTLVLVMLAALLLTATSCEFGLESKSGYTQLRDHVVSASGDKSMALDDYATIKVVTLEDGSKEVQATIGAKYDNPSQPQKYRVMRITLVMNGSVEKAILYCDIAHRNADGSELVQCAAKAEVLLTHYTGNEMVEFTATENMDFFSEADNREFATSLLNSLLLALDTYMTKNLDINVHDLGFIVLSDKYMADVDEVVTEENLGGAFSPARLRKAGIMLLQGMGMVFLVLAILWIVLLIFKVAFYKDPAKMAAKAAKKAAKEAKDEKEAEAEQVEAAPAPVAPVEAAPVAPASDDQLIAVITAAVAAAIDSDPALSSQFASGFRVVSFKKTEKSRNR
jgi:Na+-transporting methylmalonyl-CoA/oxaloacetate decarboxylase gamma subunit